MIPTMSSTVPASITYVVGVVVVVARICVGHKCEEDE